MEITLIPTHKRQVCWQVWLPANPTKYTTTVTTGVIALVNQVTQSQLTGFATRFGATFVEYRIVKAKWDIRFFSSTNPGIIQFWVDEKSNANPTLTEARERYTLSASASSTDKNYSVNWTCADPLDLQYQPVATAYNPATLKLYTDNANFGSSIVATDYVEVVPRFLLQFRELQ